MSVRIVITCHGCVHDEYVLTMESSLQSIVDYPPKTEVAVTVCCTPDDSKMIAVAKKFPFTYVLPMNQRNIFRRCVSRDIATAHCPESAIWFADADLMFGEGCLDYVSDNTPPGTPILFPRWILEYKEDAFIDSVVRIDRSKFPVRRWARNAHGGFQIMAGDMARTHGYLRSKKWQAMLSDKLFPDFRDDNAFRSYWRSRGYGDPIGIEVPELYRIRHIPRRPQWRTIKQLSKHKKAGHVT